MDSPGDKTVLVVDDSAVYADNLRQILEDVGYRVLLAVSCEAAIKLAAAEVFRVAIIDSRLPDGDGVGLASLLKARRPEAELILFTTASVIGASMTLMNANLWACLTKPCPTADLLLVVREAMHQALMLQEKRQLSERLLIAEKLAAAGTLSAGLSHEIRNPLNATLLQLILLERRVRRIPSALQPDLLEPVAAIQQEVQRLGRLMEDFLEFARPREFVPSPVDLRALAESTLALLEPQAAEAGVRLECRCDSVRSIKGEADRLRQAVLNLSLNAIQAVPAGGRVCLEVGETAGDVYLAVADTGPGIPSALRSRIFEPFYTTKPAGTGLGLPIVYSIVRRHGGTLSLDDDSKSGARFVMKFPAAMA